MTHAENKPESGRSSAHSPGEIRLGVGVVVRESALEFTFASSSGPGGQNVNRRSTKARLRVRLEELPLRPAAARRLATIASGLITDENELIITCDTSRSQKANRDECIDRLRELVAQAMVAPKPRKKTKPSRGAVERRLKDKRIKSERKSRRKQDFDG